MTGAPQTRVVVVGSGIAGLTAALELAERPGVAVTLVAKGALEDSATRLAQGGVAAVTSPDDTVASHVADTLAAGAGLCDEEAVRALCGEGPAAVATLLSRGVRFDLHEGRFARGLEAAHAHARILHAGGDATGAAIVAALLGQLAAAPIAVRERAMVLDVVVTEGRARGVRLLGGELLPADAVVLATGGSGRLYPCTTNPAGATADGVAMALRAGAAVADLEFVQFHPTALAVPGHPLVSEAVRGEGAVLRAADGRRFLADAHPDAELAPRDVVARAIAAQLARQGGAPVLLDATALGARFLAERFPTIDATVRGHGFDWSREAIPVEPVAHYAMGGVRTDLSGRTSLPGLFAVGETTCTGVHGANRLASNSLLEGAVFGRRVAAAILQADATAAWPEPAWPEQAWPELASPAQARPEPIALPAAHGELPFDRAELQRLLWDAAGLVRDAEGLARAAAVLCSWAPPEPTSVEAAETANLWLVARALVAGALARRESRGAHHRRDFPQPHPSPASRSTVLVDETGADASGSAPALEPAHA
jgi:L-aspartate oxidase